MMHALGFWHEQQRPDRDQFIKISFENVNPRNRVSIEANFSYILLDSK